AFVGLRRRDESARQSIIADDDEIVVAAASGIKEDPFSFWRPLRRTICGIARIAAAGATVGESPRRSASGGHRPDAALADVGHLFAVRRPRRLRLPAHRRRQ